jgi:hypothetical protein
MMLILGCLGVVLPSTQSVTKLPQKCIVQPGQLVYVQLLPGLTIEGYSSQAGDPSYWHNPELSAGYFPTKARPAIVLQISLDAKGYYTIWVVAIRKRQPPIGSAVKITDKISDSNDIVITDWPLEDTYCYAFPRSARFVLDPQVRLVSYMSVISC